MIETSPRPILPRDIRPETGEPLASLHGAFVPQLRVCARFDGFSQGRFPGAPHIVLPTSLPSATRLSEPEYTAKFRFNGSINGTWTSVVAYLLRFITFCGVLVLCQPLIDGFVSKWIE